jgi:hypothetical protein
MKRTVDNEQKIKQKKPETAQIRLQRTFIGLARWGKQRNVDNRNKLSHDSLVDEIRNFPQNWLQDVNRMENDRLPTLAIQYKPHGKRDICRPRRRWNRIT